MKQFMINFDPTYYAINPDYMDCQKLVDKSFFSAENGYDTTDVIAISTLNIGEQISLDHGNQQVLRVFDIQS